MNDATSSASPRQRYSRRTLILAVVAALFPASSIRAQLGPFGLDPNRRYDQNSYLGTHNAYASTDDGWVNGNQKSNLTGQLDRGVRLLNLDVHLVRQANIAALGLWHTTTYGGSDTTVVPFGFEGAPLEVVVAHDPANFGASNTTLYRNERYRTLANALLEIRLWLEAEAHRADVVTISLENTIHKDNLVCTDADALQCVVPDFEAPEVSNHVFYLDRPNPSVPVPERPQDGGWDVVKHGFPTLGYLVEKQRRLVLLPDDNHPGGVVPWRFQVNTVYGTGSQNAFGCPPVWTNERSESLPLADFTRSLFLMEHAPQVPTLGGVYNSTVSRRWDGMGLEARCPDVNLRTRWNRLPTYLLVDRFQFDSAHALGTNPPDLSDPMELVIDLNGLWASSFQATPDAKLSPLPNSSEWNRSEVWVDLPKSDPPISAIVWTTFRPGTGKQPLPSTDPGPILVEDEGTTTVSFAAIGPLGVRGEQKYVDVRIDTAPPLIDCSTGNIGTYNIDRFVDITCTASDPLSGAGEPLSGVESLSPTNIKGDAYAFGLGDIAIPVEARDKADNPSTQQVMFRIVVTFESLDVLTARFVSDPGLQRALQVKLLAARRAGASGDSAAGARHIDSYVRLVSNLSGRFITADQAQILIRAATAL